MIFQLRAYKSELDIEEIVKHRTEQIFQVISFYSLLMFHFNLPLFNLGSYLACSFQTKCAEHL